MHSLHLPCTLGTPVMHMGGAFTGDFVKVPIVREITEVPLPVSFREEFPRGKSIRDLQHTLNHFECPACTWALSLAAAEKKMMHMKLYEAAEFWLAGKISKRLLPKTIECCEGNLRNLKRFFGDMPFKGLSCWLI